jgi:uncharacterized protein with beta-barrel porin domain
MAGALFGAPAFAQDATWLNPPTVTNPADGNFDFNANANWNPTTAPGSVTNTGTATFGTSTGTSISFSAGSTSISGFTFTSAASYAFFNTGTNLTFVGAGIVVNGGSATFTNSGIFDINNNLVASANIAFLNASTAGSASITNNNSGASVQFGQSGGTDTASAGTATITNNSGSTFFNAHTTAGTATITNNSGSFAALFDSSTAGSAHITNNGGFVQFGTSGGTDTASAGSATITNNSGNTQFNANTTAGTATITNTNSGVGALGQTVFFDASTAGSATITNGGGGGLGATQFGLGGGTDTASAGTAHITNNTNSQTSFLAHTSAGSAVITNNSGSFGTIFSDASTAGSASITNNGGVTSFSGTSSAATATIANSNGGSIFFNNASTAGSATITNTGGFVQFGTSGGTDTASAGSATITNNSGNTQFNANTTAGTATIFNNSSGSGTFFTDASTAGTATITNNSGSFAAFFNSSTAGSATITNNVGGTTQFFNTSSAGTATITTNGGVTEFFANTTAGSANITTSNHGGTSFFESSSAGSATITNNVGGTDFLESSSAGSAHITNNVGGSTSFVGASSASTATITNNGLGSLTQFFNNSTAGNATITNNFGGIVAFFDRSDGGSATLINAGGLIDFSGSRGPLGDGVFNVGSIQGSGTFNVLSSQHVHVSGSLAFTSGALYIVNLRGANASQINVTGTATLAGIVGVQANTRVTQKTTFTILTSSGLNGTTFSGVTLRFTNGFARNPTLSYVGNNVLLTVDPGLLSPTLPTNASANQVKVAGAIDNGLLAGNNLSNAFSTIFNPTGAALLNGLTQLSGETATGSQQTTFNAMGQFMGALTDPFMSRGGGFDVTPGASGFAEETAYAAKSNPNEAFAAFTKAPLAKVYDPRWSVWASAFGGSQSTDGNTALGSNNTTSRIFGTAVGADYLFSPNTIVGFALAGGGTNFSVANGGTGRSDLFQIGAYVRHTNGPAYVAASLAYGWQDVTTDRTVTVAGFDQLRAQFNANAWSGRLEGGYRFATPVYGGLGVTPYAAAQFTTVDLPAYAEQAVTGLNTFALSYGARNVTDSRTELGVRTDKSWAMSDGILTLRGRLAWAHDFNPDRSIAATFQSLPGASFVVNGASQASDSTLATASIEKKWTNGWSAAATFEGEFSGVTNSYAGKGVVRYAW